MAEIPFTKMQGIGNDFVVIDGHNRSQDWSALAIRLCDRHKGVGADGLLIVEASERADLRMRMFNPDGTEDVCGNGMRCVVRYAWEQRLVTAEQWQLETGSGIRSVVISKGTEGALEAVSVDMGEPLFSPDQIPALLPNPYDYPLLLSNGDCLVLTALSTGSTHAVTFVESLPDDATFLRISPLVEEHPFFPERTSLMWCRVDGQNRLSIRIWERGLGETWGCGTGACATAIVALLHGYANPDLPVHVASKGGTLEILWRQGDSILMRGPAETLFHGLVEFVEDDSSAK